MFATPSLHQDIKAAVSTPTLCQTLQESLKMCSYLQPYTTDNEAIFKKHYLEFLIEVQDILIIFKQFSSQDALIRDRTFNDFPRNPKN